MADVTAAMAKENARVEAHLRAYIRQRALDLTRAARRRALVRRLTRYGVSILGGVVAGGVLAGL